MKTLFIVVVLVLASFILSGSPFISPNDPVNDIFETELRSFYFKSTSIEVAIADNQKTRRTGLSNLEYLPQERGLLFVFDNSDTYGIWMKDMNFPIDIIWLDKYLNVVDIHENISKDTYPTSFYPKAPVMFILEVNTGFSSKYNVEIGDIYSLDSF